MHSEEPKYKTMKLNIRTIHIFWAVLLVAVACNKEHRPGNNSTDHPIQFCATEAGATKAMLDETTFAKAGNIIKIYDYYTPAGSTTPDASPYIDDQIKSNGPGNVIWPFVNQRYNWTPDGSHKFFGWLAEDKNMTQNNTPEAFFGTGFGYANQVVTIPTKTLNAATPAFDFMYSNVHVRDLNTRPDYATAVPLEFAHLFTAFSIAAQNMSPNFEITVESVSIEGLMNTRSATVNYTNAGDGEYPVVEYANKSNDNANSPDYSFAPAYQLGTNLVDMSTKTTDRNYLMSWPMSTAESENVTLTLKYTVDNDPQVITKNIPLSGKEWVAGKKNNINLTFKDKEIILQCVVMDWIPQDEIIDFSDQVIVENTITWENVRNVNYDTGEVILYDDTSIEAICNFSFTAPKGATWTASLIPIEGHQDAFEFVGASKYGAVGVDTPVKLRVTNQAPIAPRHVCYLRITIQTADGRTIVVKNLVPGKDNAEFKVIQNLING